MSKAQETAVYTHGHHESVLRSHTWRTAANSAAYLLGSLKPHMNVLDIGCGPGTITADLAALVPDGHVTGVDHAPGILEQARTTAAERGQENVDFAVADVHALDFPDDTFCVVHAHQVLQHVGDPVQALREMRRVTRPGGLVLTLDITRPDIPVWGTLFGACFHRLVPAIGAAVAGDRQAYTYLPDSVERFLSPPELARLMERLGFRDVRYRRLALGTIAIHAATI